ncbi:MAG: 16S rRNA (uracil(1498)-N(3))-methyltransferase [Thermodesulfobacteriota bacterium]
MRRFIVEKNAIQGRSAMVTGTDARHIQKVLRYKTGDTIRLLDGDGSEYDAVISGFSSEGVQVFLGDKNPSGNEPTLDLTLAQALLKDRKLDGIIRQITELGASRLIPFVSSRSVPVPLSERFTTRLERWNKIARESIKQCRRGTPPRLDSPCSFTEMLERSSGSDLKIIFWEKAADPIPHPKPPPIRNAFLVIGPEGGFSETEIEQALAAGFIGVGLGPRILRAETAPLAAIAILQYLFGDMGYKKA